MINKLKNIWSKVVNFSTKQMEQKQDEKQIVQDLRSEAAQNSNSAKKKHDLIVMLGLGFAIIIGLVFMQYQSRVTNELETEQDIKLPLNLEVASHALDIDKNLLCV